MRCEHVTNGNMGSFFEANCLKQVRVVFFYSDYIDFSDFTRNVISQQHFRIFCGYFSVKPPDT